MKVEIKNFGPISHATIETKPLTLIIGKNNLGKSYSAQLLNTICTTLAPVPFEFSSHAPFRWMFPPGKLEEKIINPIRSKPEEEKLNYASTVIVGEYREWLEKSLKEELETGFGTSVQNLISVGSSSAEITILSHVSAKVSIDSDGEVKVGWINEREVINEVKNEIAKSVERVRIAQRRDDRLRSALTMLYNVDKKMRELILGEELSKGRSIYIPAGRAGLLESFHTVRSALLSLSPLAFTRDIKVPGLPSLAARFYITLDNLGGKKGTMFQIAEDFKNILGGDIVFKRDKETKSIEYSFKYHGKESSLNIIHTASMIKELAPLYLITKEIIKPGDFVIIEEPESHLHPGAQLELAKILAKLVNKNVYILATTQSDYFLTRIAHLVGQKSIKKDDPTSLDPQKVSIYWLRETEEGSVSEEIKIPENGILRELPTFDDIIRELYEEESSLQTAQLEK